MVAVHCECSQVPLAIYTARHSSRESRVAIDIHWICDNDSLGQHCAEWQQLPFVALDTEFMRVDTFYPIAGLIQIGDGVRAYLIDPLTIDNWQPLAALLENPAVIKVVHACSEDLEVLLRLTGSLPVPLFDTQLAAAYLNLGFSMGYSRLVQAVLDIELPKGETRSDWLQRPLSETQISYAAEDAVHLAEGAQLLDQRRRFDRQWLRHRRRPLIRPHTARALDQIKQKLAVLTHGTRVHVFDLAQRSKVIRLGFGQGPQRMLANDAVARQVTGAGLLLAPGAQLTQHGQLRAGQLPRQLGVAVHLVRVDFPAQVSHQFGAIFQHPGIFIV